MKIEIKLEGDDIGQIVKEIGKMVEANKNGISNRMITYYKNKGMLSKYSKGIYISNYEESPKLDPMIEELI